MKKLLGFLAALCLISASAYATFDGNGTFNRLYNWQADKAANINIRADRMDAEMDGFATGLSTCVTKDGQTQITHNLPMSGFRHTGVANAQSSNDYAAAGQVRDGTLCSGTSAGSVNAYTFVRTIPASSYVTGTVVYLTVPATNTTSATLNLDNIAAKYIKKGGTTDLVAGDMVSGTVYPLYYDGSFWQLPGSIPTPTPTTIINGTSSVVVGSAGTITAAISGSTVWSLNATGETVSGTVSASGIITASQGLTAAGDITATGRTGTFGLLNATTLSATQAVNTVAVSASSVAIAGVAVTTWPLSKCITSSDLTIPGSFGTVAFTHGLGAAPTMVSYWMRNTSAELGYAIGDVTGPVGGTNTGSSGFSIVQNATSTTVIWGVAPTVLNKANGANTAITAGSWKFVIKECL